MDEEEFYCKLDNSLKTDEDECSNLKLDEKALKSLLTDAGIQPEIQGQVRFNVAKFIRDLLHLRFQTIPKKLLISSMNK